MASTLDIHQHITDLILAQLEHATGDFELPWHRAGNLMRPTNAATGKPYKGVNILALWAAGETHGYSSGTWATYKQWTSLGAQVRRGEKASFVVFFKETGSSDDNNDCENGGGDSSASRSHPRSSSGRRSGPRLIARASPVFAAEQVEGYRPAAPKPTSSVDTLAAAEGFIQATGARIIDEGNRAFYRPSTDTIHLPPREAFIGTATSTATAAYYSVLLHELTHYTAHPSRCARDLGARFGKDAYAMEELVAELGAAFMCATLQITPAPRPDHAQYLKHWLEVLRGDKRAIFTAASKASQAVSFLQALQPASPSPSAAPPQKPNTIGDVFNNPEAYRGNRLRWGTKGYL